MRRSRAAAGGYRIVEMSAIRRLYVDSFDAIPNGHPMMALCGIDVTDARRVVAERRRAGEQVSLFAVVVKAIADTLEQDLHFNSVRRGRRIVEFDDVDVNLAVETETVGERLPRQLTIRRAAEKSAAEIWAEIHAARQALQETGSLGGEDAWTLRLLRVAGTVPAPVRNVALRAAARDPFRLKRLSGTTMVTSVGSFGRVPGFAIPFLRTPRAVTVVVGNVSRQPVVVGEEILPRDVLGLTVVFNHDIVDGAPAARFVTRLAERLERGEL